MPQIFSLRLRISTTEWSYSLNFQEHINAPGEQWIFCRLGNIVPDQRGFGSIKRAERTSVVAHLIIFGADRYISDCHPAQRDEFALILLTDCRIGGLDYDEPGKDIGIQKIDAS